MRVVVINRRHAYWWSRRTDDNLFIECPFPTSLIASNTSFEAALESMKLVESIGKGGCDVGSRSAVQPLGLD
jgi:hypothetical protein